MNVEEFKKLLHKLNWKIEMTAPDGIAFRRWDGLAAIVSEAVEQDGKKWRHVSASKKTRVPTWNEMQEVKEIFIGRDEYAVMVSPPRRLHVNIHPFVLHWFHCCDGHPLPEFSREAGTI